jgi:imidazole glycerol-phosphate synthase subunit HisH
MLTVVDYGAGNLRSVLHALKALDVQEICVTRTPADIAAASKLILPGVGAFGAGMQELHKFDLVEPIRRRIQDGVPYLGICLGMQFLFERSDEMGNHQGLGVLQGTVTRFPTNLGLKVPHMGWNRLQLHRPSPLAADLPHDSYAYFVHSYHCAPANLRDILMTVEYGMSFVAAIQRDHIYGVQFHPEKSQRTGLTLLKNFLAING